MTETYHYVWAILPFALLAHGLRGTWKTLFTKGGREYPRESLIQFIYCLVFLVLAITIDRTCFDAIAESLPFDEVDLLIPRWLIYPALLTIAAAIQNFFHKKKEDEERDEARERQRKYTQKGY